MKVIKIFIYHIVMLWCVFVYSLDIETCEIFGNVAHSNPEKLYMTSLNVGTGECHLVRKGDSIVIFDAGYRHASVDDHIMECLQKMMSHKTDDGKENALLKGIFISHPHNDHLNLVKPIMDESMIECSEDFCIYLGGTYGNNYNIMREFKKCYNIPSELSRYPVYIDDFYIHGGNVSILDSLGSKSANDYGGIFFLDCFGKRRIAFLGDMSRFSLEMIGSPILYNGYLLGAKTVLNKIKQHSLAARKKLYEALIFADIFTSPHHASLSNEENFIYEALASDGEKGKRICICSSSPIKKNAMPSITPILLDSFKSYNSVFKHMLTCDCGLDDSIIPPKTTTITENITYPIFSTYDAVGGIVWTCINPNGGVEIYDDINNEFTKVLQ